MSKVTSAFFALFTPARRARKAARVNLDQVAQCRRTDEGPTLCQHCQPGSARALPTAAWSRQSQRVPATHCRPCCAPGAAASALTCALCAEAWSVVEVRPAPRAATFSLQSRAAREAIAAGDRRLEIELRPNGWR